MSDESISNRLAAHGIKHERTPNATTTGKHRLWYAESGVTIGEFTAAQACQLLETLDAAQT